jgi:hypothetical protein
MVNYFTQPVLLFGSDERLPAPYGLLAAVQGAHSGLRYLILIALVLAIVMAYKAMKAGSNWDGNSKRFGKITMMLVDLQFLMGVFLWVYFIYLNSNFKPNKLKNILNETVLRYFVMEHAVMMFIALILIHLGVRKAKRTISGADANKAQFRFFLAALILILVAIPWPFYGVIGRGWF